MCFKHMQCGWCGAISEAAPHASKHTSNAFVRCLKAPGSGLLRLLSRLRILVVAFVTLLIASIIVLGVGFVLTRMCESEASWYAHSIITWALSFSTFFNFFAAVSLSPGTVLECVRIPKRSGRELIPQHSFENFKYCWPCKAPKAPGAHHCSVCNKCIMDMDHHCPFINNCVGRAWLPRTSGLLYSRRVLAVGLHARPRPRRAACSTCVHMDEMQKCTCVTAFPGCIS